MVYRPMWEVQTYGGNEKCPTNNVLYKTSIIPKKKNSKMKTYYGPSETAFKLRYANHKKTFNNIKYQTDIALSNKYWNKL